VKRPDSGNFGRVMGPAKDHWNSKQDLVHKSPSCYASSLFAKALGAWRETMVAIGGRGRNLRGSNSPCR